MARRLRHTRTQASDRFEHHRAAGMQTRVLEVVPAAQAVMVSSVRCRFLKASLVTERCTRCSESATNRLSSGRPYYVVASGAVGF